MADEGATKRDTSPRRHGWFRDTRRLELGPREPVVWRADGTVAAVRRAAPERVHAGGLHGRRRGDEGGQEEEQFRGGRGAGASGEGADGRWRGGEEGEGEGHGDEGRLQERRGGWWLILRCAVEAIRGDHVHKSTRTTDEVRQLYIVQVFFFVF